MAELESIKAVLGQVLNTAFLIYVAADRQALERAVKLYRGDLLPSCYDESCSLCSPVGQRDHNTSPIVEEKKNWIEDEA